MKRFVLAAAALCVLGTISASWSAEQGCAFPCLPAPSTLRLDGALDEWAALPYIPLNSAKQALFDQRWNGSADLSARIYLAWTSASLYIAAQVWDKNVIVGEQGPQARNDGLEIVISPPLPTTQALCHLFASPAGANNECLVLDVATATAFSGARGRYIRSGGGYTLELALPWAMLFAGAAEPGVEFSLGLRVHDFDNPMRTRRAKLAWGWPVPDERSLLLAGQRPYGGDLLYGTLPELGEEQPLALSVPQPVGRVALLQAPPYDDLTRYIGAVVALSLSKTYYKAGEQAQVTLISGAPLGWGPFFARFIVTDERGRRVGKKDMRFWREDPWRGLREAWRVPPGRDRTFSVNVEVRDARGKVVWQASRQLRVLGEAYAVLHAQLDGLRWRAESYLNAPYDPKDLAVCSYGPSLWPHVERLTRWVNDADKRIVRAEPDVLQRQLDQLQAALNELEQRRDPLRWRRGVVVKAYRSALDDSRQPYSVWVPEEYTGEEPFPLLVVLHGFGGRYSENPPRPPWRKWLVLWPQGRGNTDYKAWGEVDVLRAIAEVRRDYNVDAKRIYLHGGSMGGTGTWHLGVHYPHLFAALVPLMGNTNHHVWEEKWLWGERETTPLSAIKGFLEDCEDAITFAENLRNLPVYCVHGSDDDVVPVEHSRTIVRKLRGLGYPVFYDEQQGKKHGGFPTETFLSITRWLENKVCEPWPKHVTIKTARLRHGRAYWARIDRLRRWLSYAVLDAQVRGQTIDVRAENVARYTLFLSGRLVDLTQPITVITNGAASFSGKPPQSGVLVVDLDAQPQSGLHKRAGLEGPIEDAFLERFLLVIGASGDDDEAKRVNEEQAKKVAEHWARWAQGTARIKYDYEVTEEDIAQSNLVLFGGPSSNKIAAQVNARLPIRIERDAVVVGQRRFAGPDVGVKLIYPNPLNPERYVVLFAGVSARAMRDIATRFGNWFDWGVFSNRNWFDFAVFDDRTYSPETFLVVGFFDAHWRLCPETMWFGDERLRRGALVRELPQASAAEAASDFVYLSDLQPRRVSIEKGAVGINRSFAGRKITLGGRAYDKGLGVHPNCEIVYDIAGKFSLFEADVGIDLEGASEVSQARAAVERVKFQVFGDGRLLVESGEMRWNTPPRRLVANVIGVHELKLVTVRSTGKPWLYGDASWGNARLLQQRLAAPEVSAEGRPGAELCGSLSLNGAWLLRGLPPGEGALRTIYLPEENPPGQPVVAQSKPDYVLEATVPCTVAAAVAAAQLLPEPYRDRGAERYRELESREWWFCRWFSVPQGWRGRRVFLEFDGASCHADAFLNGRLIGSWDGMFHQARFEVSQYLRYGAQNFLAVRTCPDAWPLAGHVANPGPPAAQKALVHPMGYGWSFAPRLFPIGLWRSVRLRCVGPARIDCPAVRVEDLSPTRATLAISAAINARPSGLAGLRLRGEIEPLGFDAPGRSFVVAISPSPGETTEAHTTVTLPEPQLWWPRGLGEQRRYRLKLALILPSGAISDKAELQFGIVKARPMLASYRPLPGGGAPQLVPLTCAWEINGVAGVRAPALRWVPCDALLRLGRERYERLLRAACQAGVRLLEVWGGGLYETDEFYDLCDELGIMVVQDLPLAGTTYRPADRALFAQTLRQNIRRLRNHPSLVAYCAGDDLDPNHGDNRALIAQARAVLQEEDAQRYVFLPYRRDPSKRPPARGPLDKLCAAAPPPLEDLRQFIPPSREWPPNNLWAHHGADLGELEALVARHGPPLANVEQALPLASTEQYFACRWWLDRILCGEDVRYEWGFQLNDPWPCVSPSLLDWFGGRKGAFYAFQEASRPTRVCLLVPTEWAVAGGPARLSLAVVNNSSRPRPGLSVNLWFVDATGKTFPLPTVRGINLAPFSSTQVIDLPAEVPAQAEGPALLVCARLRAADGAVLDRAQQLMTIASAPYGPPVARVLWLAGNTDEARRKTRFLRSLGVEVVVAPFDRAEEYLDPSFGAIVLSPAADGPALPAGATQRIVDLARGGCGLVFDGRVHMWRGTPLEPFCPLFARAEWLLEEQQSVVLAAEGHAITDGLAAPQGVVLDRVPVAALAGGAVELLRADGGMCLAAVQTVGRTRCAALAGGLCSASMKPLWGWPEYRPFLAALLAFTAGGGHRELLLVKQLPTHPLQGLAELCGKVVPAAKAWSGAEATVARARGAGQNTPVGEAQR